MHNISTKQIKHWQQVTPEVFANEIRPLNKPAVLKGLVQNWPAVKQAQINNNSLYNYFSNMYVGGDVPFARISAEEKGRVFYNQDMSGFNFKREVAPLDSFFREVIANSQNKGADTLALQSAPVADYFTDFEKENPFHYFF